MGSGMDGDGFRKCIRLCNVLANFLILVGAISVMAVGIWTIVDKSYLENVMRNSLYMSAAYTLIAVGAITIIISFLGCMGSLAENRILLLTYFVFVLLLFVVLLIGGVLAYVFRHQIANNMRPEMERAIKSYDPDRPDDPITKTFDAIQNQLKCCGIQYSNNSTKGVPWEAWYKNNRINSGSADQKVPESCCKLDANGAKVECNSSNGNNVDTDRIYTSDCFTVALVFLRDHTVIIGGVAVGIAAIMILGMVFSIVHYKLIEKVL